MPKEDHVKKFEPRRIVFGCLWALAYSLPLVVTALLGAGLFPPVLAMDALYLWSTVMFGSLAVYVFLPPILIAVLYAWSGAIPAALAAVGTLGLGYLLGGPGVMAALGVVVLLPALVAILCVEKRLAFFRSVRICVAAQFAALVALIALGAISVQGDLADALAQFMYRQMTGLPNELVDILLTYANMVGLLGTGANLTAGAITAADRINYLRQLTETFAQALKLAMPSLTLQWSMVTGLVLVLWPSWIRVRRGDEPAVPYLPMDKWRLPNNTALGMLLCYLVSLLLLNSSIAGIDAVYTAVSNVFGLLLMIQGLATLCRYAKVNGMGRGARIAFIVLGITLARFVLGVVGFFSVMFGHEGVVTNFIKKQRDKHNKEDE